MQFKNIIQDLYSGISYVRIYTQKRQTFVREMLKLVVFPRKPRQNKKHSLEWAIKGFTIICLEKNSSQSNGQGLFKHIFFFICIKTKKVIITKLYHYLFLKLEINFVRLFFIKPKTHSRRDIALRTFTFLLKVT